MDTEGDNPVPEEGPKPRDDGGRTHEDRKKPGRKDEPPHLPPGAMGDWATL